MQPGRQRECFALETWVGDREIILLFTERKNAAEFPAHIGRNAPMKGVWPNKTKRGRVRAPADLVGLQASATGTQQRRTRVDVSHQQFVESLVRRALDAPPCELSDEPVLGMMRPWRRRSDIHA